MKRLLLLIVLLSSCSKDEDQARPVSMAGNYTVQMYRTSQPTANPAPEQWQITPSGQIIQDYWLFPDTFAVNIGNGTMIVPPTRYKYPKFWSSDSVELSGSGVIDQNGFTLNLRVDLVYGTCTECETTWTMNGTEL